MFILLRRPFSVNGRHFVAVIRRVTNKQTVIDDGLSMRSKEPLFWTGGAKNVPFFLREPLFKTLKGPNESRILLRGQPCRVSVGPCRTGLRSRML